MLPLFAAWRTDKFFPLSTSFFNQILNPMMTRVYIFRKGEILYSLSSLSIFIALLSMFRAQPTAPNSVQDACHSMTAAMPPVEIQGNHYVCPKSTETYSLVPNQGSTYLWSLNSGGGILSQNGATARVEWGTGQGTGPHILRVEETDVQNLVTIDTFHVYIKNVVLACNDTVQVSLDENGEAWVFPDMILEGSYNTFQGFTVSLKDQAGRQIGNKVTCSHIGQYLTATVTGDCDQNSCWSTIYVEDKMAPAIDCEITADVNNHLGTLDASDLKFNRTATFVPGSDPNTCILSAVGVDNHYETFEFSITVAGTYTFDMTGNTFDAFAALYAGAFDPLNPCLNLLAADDDSGTSQFGPRIVIQLGLSAGNYILVTTSFAPSTTGDYQWFLTGPAGAPVRIRSNTITIDCSVDPADIPAPTARDNCDPNPLVTLIKETVTGDNCGITHIERVYETADRRGNRGIQSCTIWIKVVSQKEIKFPDDITWTCEQYQAFPNIINPTALHHCILSMASAIDQSPIYCLPGTGGDDFANEEPYDMSVAYWADGEDLDISLDPRYDDNIDNPLTDPNPNQIDPVTNLPIFSTIGNVSQETDNLPANCNLSTGLCPYMDTLINYAHHKPDTIIIPRYRPQNNLIRGLEDADALAGTGSGVPNIFQTNCAYAVTYQDQKLEACEGVDTNIVFKILRTWTILNWCNGQITSDIQVIKVVDKFAPTIKRDTFHVNANLYANSQHGECRSTEFLLPPVIKDNCTPIASVQIFTPVGEAVYLNGTDGRAGGLIPLPGLKVGTHTIKYVATDACGNRTEHFVDIKVIDDIVPIMICREFTEVSLTLDGTGKVEAYKFDEGSNDNCCIDYFMVKRMGEPDSLFRPEIIFNCSEDTVMVILRAYDCSGNYNECMIEVRIQDKLRPDCYAPADVWVSCSELHHLDLKNRSVLENYFGKATGYDNCDSIRIEELTPQYNLDHCGVGTIIRTFRVFDRNGLSSVSTCRQRINIKADNTYKINFPPDWTGKCHDLENAEDVTFTQGFCDRLAVNHEDLRFNLTSDGACYKIIRTWRVMNWCVYDGFSDPIEVPNHPLGVMVTQADYNGHGYYSYKQIIKVIDTEAPVVTYNGPTEFCGGLTPDCIGAVDIYPEIDEKCTVDLSVEWKLDVFNDGTNNANGIGRLKRNIPLGKHKVVFEVRDGCGNKTLLTILFEVRDCKKPTPVCINGLSADLMQNGMLALPATYFERSSFDYCTPYDELKFRINRIEDLNNDFRITPNEYINTVPQYDTVQFRCRNYGLTYVQMWVGDNYGNWDYCVTFIDIQDNMNMCSTGSKISGKITTEQGQGVQGVKVELSGNQPFTAMTQADGLYEFPNVEKDYDYTVAPGKDEDVLNGVTTFDLALIGKHILQIQRLGSPYKIIAADVNRSGSISTVDIVELRRLILRVQNNLRSNTSWRFVDKAHIFPDPANPFSRPFPEVVSYNNYSQDELNTHFVAVKVGDVNGSAKTNNLDEVDNRTLRKTLRIRLENRIVAAGTELPLTFEVEHPEDLLGFQFTLDFDKEALELIDVQENDLVGNEHFGFALLDDGAITASWDRTGKTVNGKMVLGLTFKTRQEVRLHEAFNITSRHTLAEAYRLDGEAMNVALGFGDSNAAVDLDFDLYQNKPNPFSKGTVIGFQLPETTQSTITIFDMAGRQVSQYTGMYQKGYNEISLGKRDLPGAGIYYYRLETNTHTATRKMLLVD